MEIIKTIAEMRLFSENIRKNGKTLGLVPTMGYLHDGHASLVKQSKSDNDATVVSIFVNPLQFGENEDLSTYPSDFERDSALLQLLGVDAIFCPSPNEMYGRESLTKIKVAGMSEKLCGKSRPIHFEGVTTVVAKLFNITDPSIAYFGSKDLQQFIIIKKMVEDLNLRVKVKPMPIIREKSGLAMSSRNIYLTKDERKSALSLSSSLELARNMINSGEKNSVVIIETIKKLITKHPSAEIDYVSIVDITTLENMDTISDKSAILLAVKYGKARLIDNITVSPL